jgi:hypothetical protein
MTTKARNAINPYFNGFVMTISSVMLKSNLYKYKCETTIIPECFIAPVSQLTYKVQYFDLPHLFALPY